MIIKDIIFLSKKDLKPRHFRENNRFFKDEKKEFDKLPKTVISSEQFLEFLNATEK